LLLLGLVDIELRGGVLVWAALTMPAEPLAGRNHWLADALRAKWDQPRSHRRPVRTPITPANLALPATAHQRAARALYSVK
jgi:hypothetical protein